MTSVEGRELNRILQLTFKLVAGQVQGIQRGELDDRFGEGACYSGGAVRRNATFSTTKYTTEYI